MQTIKFGVVADYVEKGRKEMGRMRPGGGHTVRCWSLVGRKERKGGKRENEKGEWGTWRERFASGARM